MNKEEQFHANLVEKIAQGKIENGLSELLLFAGKLSYDEKNYIFTSWNQKGLKKLIFLYQFPLLLDNYEAIKISDGYYLKNEEEKNKKLGR
jgi:hypothetical protein